MKICTRQICFIMLAYTAVSKIIIYPTFLSSLCGRDLWFPALFSFAVQAVVVWAISYLCSRTDKTLFQLIEGTLGNICARIIYGLFGLFFILGTIMPLIEQKLYTHAIFYDTVPSLLVFLPFFMFSVYAASKKFTNIGRSADICLPLFVLSLLFLLVMSLWEVHWDNFLPAFKTPAKDLFGGSLATAYLFFEPCWLLMFMGHFKYNKWDATKITASYIGGGLLVMLILFIYYGIYGEAAVSRQFAISKISLFFPAIDLLGRIDLVALYVLEVVMLFAVVLNIQLAVHCFAECTGWQNRAALSAIVNGILLVLIIVLDSKYNSLSQVFGKWLWIVFLLFATVVPLLSWAMKRRAK